MALPSANTLTTFGFQPRPSLPTSPSLIFVETEDQVQQVLSDPRQYRADAFVALEPEAAWALRQAGKPYLKLEDGYDESCLCDLAHEMLDEQLSWADQVDIFLQESLPQFRQTNFRPAQLYLYWLKIVFDTIHTRAHPLKWALETWKPSQVIYPGECPANNKFGWDLMYHQTLYPEILGQIAKQFPQTEFVAPEMPQLAASDIQTSSSGAPYWQVRHPIKKLLYPFLKLAYIWGRAVLDGATLSGEKSWVISPTYDLIPVWEMIRQRRHPFARWDILVDRFRGKTQSPVYHQTALQMKEIWHEINLRPFFRAIARSADIELWQVAEWRLNFWWHTLIPQQWAVYEAARHFYRHKPPRAVAVTGLVDHVERGVFAALRSLQIPTFIYQHGGFVGWCEDVAWDVMDPLLADYQLTHGLGMTRWFKERQERYNGARALPITVGSSRLDSLRRRFSKETLIANPKPSILFVPNIIVRFDRYLDCGNLPDVTEAEIQAEMINTAREFPQYDFVYKAFSDQTDTPAMRTARQPGSNCRELYSGRLTDLMQTSDLIVLNFPSSAMMEALCTNRPLIILVDNRSIRMLPQAKEALGKRAIIAETPQRFIEAIHSFLKRGDFSRIANPDQSFLELYGTYSNDGLSAERALAEIMNSRNES
ncbi:MAG: hypothetical protein HY808_07400 [Nitrospirae bacterium]|nr:hypothetical protein [Nitrospirota bacterium]